MFGNKSSLVDKVDFDKGSSTAAVSFFKTCEPWKLSCSVGVPIKPMAPTCSLLIFLPLQRLIDKINIKFTPGGRRPCTKRHLQKSSCPKALMHIIIYKTHKAQVSLTIEHMTPTIKDSKIVELEILINTRFFSFKVLHPNEERNFLPSTPPSGQRLFKVEWLVNKSF